VDIVDAPPAGPRPGDANRDFIVDLQDFGILKEHYGHAGDADTVPVTVVPEPVTMALLALGAAAVVRRKPQCDLSISVGQAPADPVGVPACAGRPSGVSPRAPEQIISIHSQRMVIADRLPLGAQSRP
jgi:hypothetical protein